MHGRLKVKTTEQQAEEKRKEKQIKANKFQEGLKLIFSRRQTNELNKENLELISNLLVANPDVYTLWNIRREILLHEIDQLSEPVKSDDVDSSEANAEDVSGVPVGEGDQVNKTEEPKTVTLALLKNELELTAVCLTRNLKSYCAWFHRCWTITLMDEPNYSQEITLCNRLLELDERNFHCWDYRRRVCKLAKISISDELNFTLEKIKQNFSNFSSFYYRNSLYTYADLNNILKLSDYWNDEYELVQNALFTDPSDQSPWFYHKWLSATNFGVNVTTVAQRNDSENGVIERIIYDAVNSFLVVLFNKAIRFQHYNAEIHGHNEDINCNNAWNAVQDGSSKLWTLPLPSNTSNIFKSITLMPSNTDANVLSDKITLDIDGHFDIICWVQATARDVADTHLQPQIGDEYLESLKCLHELEPENKWVNLSLALINPEKNNMSFGKLKQLDPIRSGYYDDQNSKIQFENAIASSLSSCVLQLNNSSLTCLYHTERLCHIRILDLSHNNLSRISKSFNNLVCLESLHLDFNKIKNVQPGVVMKCLKKLSLQNNRMKLNTLDNLKDCKNLEKVFVYGNAMASNSLVTNLHESVQIVIDHHDQLIQESLARPIPYNFSSF